MTNQGTIDSILDYILELEANGNSQSKINSSLISVSKLIEYMDANKKDFDNPKILFQTFTKRLYTGTIGDDGIDPSGLYWFPPSTNTVNKYINNLTSFFNFIYINVENNKVNPLRDSSPHEERINYAAWYYKNQNNFLGHIKDKSINQTTKRIRTIKGRRTLNNIDNDGIAFPEEKFPKLFFKGITQSKDNRIILRDQLILLLMHFGGLRESEAIILWISDVLEDNTNPNSAIVRIYNEIDGIAPHNWKSKQGKKTRIAYLKQVFGRIPRIHETGTMHIGWKNRIVDHKDNYIQVQFFPNYMSTLFNKLWRQYIMYRAKIECNHPYAFISFKEDILGSPYTINAFTQNYKSAIKKIELVSSKENGTTPHAHRHSYGRRLENSGVHHMIIKKCMHHKSLNSQLPYISKSQKAINDSLNTATMQLDNIKENQHKNSTWKELCEYGFKDLDPNELFTGINPKLLRNHNEK